jgi:hypothetical protein
MHLDLVLPLDHSTYSYFLFQPADPTPPPRTQLAINLNSGPILFHRFMLECRAALAQMPQLNNKRLAFTESGLSFLVPENVRIGDMVCNIRGTNDLIIGRPRKQLRYNCQFAEPTVCHSIACSVFNLWPLNPESLHRRTEVKLDLYALQMMSVVSAFPNEEPEGDSQAESSSTCSSC